MESPYAIEMLNITKRFPGIIANDNITLQLKKGEIHALLGENGAGKSTLMSVLFGLYQPEEGVIKKDGQVVSIKDPNDANALGIGMVHQHFKLVECFSVLDNIIMGAEPTKCGFLQKKDAREKVLALSEKYGLHVDPDALIEDITVGMQQRTEILKMLYRDNEILIFDEPTAVLTPQETNKLFNAERFARCKDGAILINVGRGTTVDSDALVEALRSGRELECIYIQSGSPKGPVAAILNKAREQGIPVKEATREKLTQLSGIETHQGVAAICAAAAYAEMKDIYERAGEEPLFVVICDNIEDPHNLGAIIRTAEACGAHGVIIPKRHSAGLTAAAVKSSAGAAVCLPVVRVANIVATMQSLKAEKNVWFICADMDGVNWCQLDFKGAVGLVIGSEGNGVSRLVKEECDFVAALPMQGQINSLNASVAGGIILYEITRQRLGLKAR